MALFRKGAVPELDSGLAKTARSRSLSGALIGALDTDLEWGAPTFRLTVKALEWEQAERDRSFLLRGAELRRAQRAGWPRELIGPRSHGT